MVINKIICDICGKDCSDKYTKLTLPYYLKMGECNIDGVTVENKILQIGERDICPKSVKILCDFLNIVDNEK